MVHGFKVLYGVLAMGVMLGGGALLWREVWSTKYTETLPTVQEAGVNYQDDELLSTGRYSCQAVQKVYNESPTAAYGNQIQWCPKARGYYVWQPTLEGGGYGMYFNRNGERVGETYYPDVMFGGKESIQGKIFSIESCKRIDVTPCSILDVSWEGLLANKLYQSSCEKVFLGVMSAAYKKDVETSKYISYTGKNWSVCTDEKEIYYVHTLFQKDLVEWETGEHYPVKSLGIYSVRGELIEELGGSQVQVQENYGYLKNAVIEGKAFKKKLTSCVTYYDGSCDAVRFNYLHRKE